MELNTDRHALRLSHLSVTQQQRALKKLAQQQRSYNKANKANAESDEVNTYDWHRKVRLAREARAWNIVRGYLKGLPYKAIENNLKPSTIEAVRVMSYIGGRVPYSKGGFFYFDQKFQAWLEA